MMDQMLNSILVTFNCAGIKIFTNSKVRRKMPPVGNSSVNSKSCNVRYCSLKLKPSQVDVNATLV